MAKHQPSRRCISCREARHKRDLIRLVRGADGSVAIDPTGKAAGRGAYLCAQQHCWDRALAHRLVDRALKVALDGATRDQFATHAAVLPKELAENE